MKSKSFNRFAVKLLLPTYLLRVSKTLLKECSTMNARCAINDAKKRTSSFLLDKNLKLMKYKAKSKLMNGF